MVEIKNKDKNSFFEKRGEWWKSAKSDKL